MSVFADCALEPGSLVVTRTLQGQNLPSLQICKRKMKNGTRDPTSYARMWVCASGAPLPNAFQISAITDLLVKIATDLHDETSMFPVYKDESGNIWQAVGFPEELERTVASICGYRL